MQTTTTESAWGSAFKLWQTEIPFGFRESLEIDLLSQINEMSCFSSSNSALTPTTYDPVQSESLRRNAELHRVDQKTAEGIDKVDARLERRNAAIKSKITGLESQLRALSTLPQNDAVRGKRERLQKKIAKLRSQLRPLFQFHATMNKLERIAESSASDQDKKAAIEALRKNTGLNSGEMRKLFTKRVSRVYEDSANRLESAEAQANVQQTNLQNIYGMPVSQIMYAGGSSSVSASSGISGEVARLRGIKSFTGKLYPPPVHRSFWSKVKGAVSKIGSGLKKVGGFLQKVGTRLKSVGSFFMNQMTGVLKNLSALAWTRILPFMPLR